MLWVIVQTRGGREGSEVGHFNKPPLWMTPQAALNAIGYCKYI